MTRIGMISNPLSRKNKAGLEGIEAVAGAAPELLHHRLGNVAELPAVLDDFVKQGVGLLVLNGGDGTVQAALTDLLERRPFPTLPPVALLPRGTTNMTAADIGLKGADARALARLIDAARTGRLDVSLRERRVLRLENIKGRGPLHGMFFGAAGICQAIEICREQVHPLNVGAELTSALTLARVLLKWMLRGGGSNGIHGEEMTVEIDGAGERRDKRLLALATTLDRLVLGSRPFWNDEGADLRFTTIAYPPRRLLLSAPKVLYGGPRRSLPPGYESQGAGRVALRLAGRFTLDGELYDPDPERPLLITAPNVVRFVRL